MSQAHDQHKVRIGIAGFGTAGRSFIAAIRRHPGFELVAVAEPVPAVREEIVRTHGAAAYEDLAGMLMHPVLDAVYIATPTPMHEQHVLQSVQAGKHVLVEKPLAIRAERALGMVRAAERAGVVFVVGHSHGFDLPVRRMREIIASGELGRVRMIHNWCYTDWMLRPRRTDELDVDQGGGVTYRQGSHQFDVIRLLGGGLVRSVRARAFDWNPDKPGIGAHVVWLDFVDGAVATAVYNGYGAFSSTELCSNINPLGFEQAPELPAAPVAGLSPEQIALAKQERARSATWDGAPYQPFLGLTVVSCERGDIRQSPKGLLIYSAQGRTEIELPTGRGGRDFVLDELHDAITGKAAAQHDGRWGLANLELCDAAIESSASGREVLTHHQVATLT